jgi:hypothetical protein
MCLRLVSSSYLTEQFTNAHLGSQCGSDVLNLDEGAHYGLDCR